MQGLDGAGVESRLIGRDDPRPAHDLAGADGLDGDGAALRREQVEADLSRADDEEALRALPLVEKELVAAALNIGARVPDGASAVRA